MITCRTGTSLLLLLLPLLLFVYYVCFRFVWLECLYCCCYHIYWKYHCCNCSATSNCLVVASGCCYSTATTTTATTTTTTTTTSATLFSPTRSGADPNNQEKSPKLLEREERGGKYLCLFLLKGGTPAVGNWQAIKHQVRNRKSKGFRV